MSKTPIDISDWPAPEELIKRQTNGESLVALAAELGASRTRVTRYMKGLNPVVSEKFIDPEEAICQQDIRFIEAMAAAVNAGQETAAFGIKVDTSPLVPKRFQGDTIFSGCGSPAAACAHALGNMSFGRT